eukprot:scaffold83176_cov36-Phaeocystis_antarctica.AAC.1
MGRGWPATPALVRVRVMATVREADRQELLDRRSEAEALAEAVAETVAAAADEVAEVEVEAEGERRAGVAAAALDRREHAR